MANQSVIASDLLVKTTQKVFESLGLWNVTPCDSARVIADAAILGVITFRGDIEGCLGVCCPRECAEALAVITLGRDWDEDVWLQEINDTFGALVNGIMNGIAAERGIFREIHLFLPTVIHGKEVKLETRGEARMMSRVKFSDQHALELSLSWSRA